MATLNVAYTETATKEWGVSVGYELRRQLADTLPEGLSSGERLVALEFADQANDRTRLAYGRRVLTLVARRCGFANEKQVGKVLGKLAKRGIELRVQITRDGKPVFDHRGRPVFAYDGRETTYQIPVFGEPAAPPPGEDSPPVVPQEGDHSADEQTRADTQTGNRSPVVVSQAGEHFSTGGPETTPSGPPPGTPPETSGPPLGSKWSPQRGTLLLISPQVHLKISRRARESGKRRAGSTAGTD